MNQIMEALFRVLEGVLVILLAGMVVMVFGNVVLRYAFNSGIELSEEMARCFFVWLTFIGAVTTFRKSAHLGVETFVQYFGRSGQVVLMTVSNTLIVLCCAALFLGTWNQHEINSTTSAPVTGISMIWVYGVLYFTSVSIGAMSLTRIACALAGKVSDEEIARFSGEFGSDASTVRAGVE